MNKEMEEYIKKALASPTPTIYSSGPSHAVEAGCAVQPSGVFMEMNFNIIRAENGFILRTGSNSLGASWSKYFVCNTPEELAQRIVAVLVEEKMK